MISFKKKIKENQKYKNPVRKITCSLHVSRVFIMQLMLLQQMSQLFQDEGDIFSSFLQGFPLMAVFWKSVWLHHS